MECGFNVSRAWDTAMSQAPVAVSLTAYSLAERIQQRVRTAWVHIQLQLPAAERSC